MADSGPKPNMYIGTYSKYKENSYFFLKKYHPKQLSDCFWRTGRKSFPGQICPAGCQLPIPVLNAGSQEIAAYNLCLI